jgi:23S rRNA (guanine2445-N2)-methyltransferase
VRHPYFVPCASGLEPALLAEMTALGLQDCRQDTGGVHFAGEAADCYRANLWLRCGARVLRVLAEFPCTDDKALYQAAHDIAWERLMSVEQTLAVRVVLGSQGRGSALTHSQYLSRRIKDAIVDRFRERLGRRPDVDPQHPHLPVHAYLAQGRCTLSLDTSAPPLFMRGYRAGAAEAPLKETLAAGLIGLAGWSGERPFYDFFCGSGTLPIEAALLAGHRAPGLLRERFAFQSWPDYRPELFAAQAEQARRAARPVSVAIHASDRDPRAVAAARENARRAGVADAIVFSVQDAADFRPQAGPGLVLINPPYGERMGDREALQGLYRQIGDTLKQRCAGSEAHIFTVHSELIKSIGLHASRRVVLFNGPIECRLLQFKLY